LLFLHYEENSFFDGLIVFLLIVHTKVKEVTFLGGPMNTRSMLIAISLFCFSSFPDTVHINVNEKPPPPQKKSSKTYYKCETDEHRLCKSVCSGEPCLTENKVEGICQSSARGCTCVVSK